MATYTFPFQAAAKVKPGTYPWERTDMGVDFGGKSNILAIGAGKILRTIDKGWPGGTFIVEQLDVPYQGHKYVYYAEDITPSVKVGQRVTSGQVIGRAYGGPTGVELGFASNTAPHGSVSKGYVEGHATPTGNAFHDFLVAIASGKLSQPTPSAGVGTLGAKTPSATTTPAAPAPGQGQLGSSLPQAQNVNVATDWASKILDAVGKLFGVPSVKDLAIRFGFIILGGILLLIGVVILAAEVTRPEREQAAQAAPMAAMAAA